MSKKKIKLYSAPLVSAIIISSMVLCQGISLNIGTDTTIDEPPTEEVITEPIEPIEPIESPEPELYLTESEINLIARITMAEAENQPELGKRLVIDTILNRMEHESYWPDTIEGVIYQKSQFTCVWNGRLDRCYVKEDIYNLVKEELVSRTNYDVVYFRTGKYSSYGTPLFKEGDHYFSSL